VTPQESSRRSAAALDKLRGSPSATMRAAVETITNANRGHAVVVDAAQTVLNDLWRRVDELSERQGREAQAERERMSQRLGRSFRREVE
jgi:hypothetical protein